MAMKAKFSAKNRVLNRSNAPTGGGKPGSKSTGGSSTYKSSYIKRSDRTELDSQLRADAERVDGIFGFEKMVSSTPKLGWLLNYVQQSVPDDLDANAERSALELYFIDKSGGNFKATLIAKPYLYIELTDAKKNNEVIAFIQRQYPGCQAEEVDKDDLDMPNHLSGIKHKFIRLFFKSVNAMNDVKTVLRGYILTNKKNRASHNEDLFADSLSKKKKDFEVKSVDPFEYIADMREFDLTYCMRMAIDKDIRVGAWYLVSMLPGTTDCQVIRQPLMLELCQPRILAFDIECEKAPLKFPNAENDRIYMISYMVAGQGFLIVNREIVSEDILDFEYTPMSKYPGPFAIFNESTEESLLNRFVSHVQEVRPHVIVTYNGDFFDWPYVDKRCKIYGISLLKQLGICGGEVDGVDEYRGRCIVHLDAFAWVQRDSYLPQGTQGLKAVTRAKLGYDPVEVDPEDMTRLAVESPHHMAAYSVSDAVATYYLYTVYVHNFIFSMSTIIPLNSEDVLRKGSGTLCEALLMVEACTRNIICPNKQVDPLESFHQGHLLESETYIGGHVECLEAGVFRADIPSKFSLVPSALQGLINHIDRDITFALETEHGIERTDVLDYDAVKQQIVEKLELLRDSPNRIEKPLIYHLDVGAMYPNIILTNRLQPGSLVSLSDCAACDFNRKENDCKRNMKWTWRGEYSPAGMNEYQSIKSNLAYEKVEGRLFSELPEKQQIEAAKARLKSYSQKVYKKNKLTEVSDKENTVCMRENPFYVNTVRDFRNRRYEYKLETKNWKGKKIEAEKKGDAVGRKAAEDKEVLMDSLQLAHKCILNSFYGYVMRKGARWRSMEMAGIVTYTGAQLIKQARELVEQIGRPLELDTDGIWCILPASFPQDFKLKFKRSGVDDIGVPFEKIDTIKISYPCAMLNADVHARYTNHQYQDLVDTSTNSKKYVVHSECSIFFELDGPYKAMILPASPEEGKLLKKKYVVFNFDGSIAELKGFELKRRGELEIVKLFQENVFNRFLDGDTLASCYAAVGAIANYWLDILDNKGENINDDELMHYISEKKTISKTLEDYDGRKATSLTTAGRLADFLGAEMVKDKGLNCNLIISRLPLDAPVTDRAIPVAIFSAEHSTRNYYLRKWLKDPYLDCTDFRDVVDWDYYKMRLGNTIQKIITIPAGMQQIVNPCPRVLHPVWLQRGFDERSSGKRQLTITSLFGPKLITGAALHMSPIKPTEAKIAQSVDHRKRSGDQLTSDIADLEDMLSPQRSTAAGRPVVHSKKTVMEPSTPPESLPQPEVPSISPVVGLIPMLPPVNEEDGTPDGAEVADIETWLAHRKAMWKSKRKERKNAKQHKLDLSIKNAFESGARKAPMGITDILQNASLQASYGVWQIIELQETSVPGEFVAWVMTSRTQMQRLNLIVPRIFYVNLKYGCSDEIAVSLGGKKVSKFLPHDKPCQNLFEISLTEKRMIRGEKGLSNLRTDPNVEGVYEMQVPLCFRAVTRIGCVAKVSKNSMNRGARAYNLNDLELLSTQGQPYLSVASAVYRKIYIYHTVDKSRTSKLGIVALFIIEGNNEDEERRLAQTGSSITTSKAYIWYANSYATQDSKPPLQRIFRRHEPDERVQVKFTSVNTASVADALSECNERLRSYTRERKGPTIAVVQGSYGIDPRTWRNALPVLQEFPVVAIPPNSTDDMYPAPIYWQNFVSERMVQRFRLFPDWLFDRMESARFSNTPVSNLGNDAAASMTDILLARRLEAGRQLLWASERQFPDLGGSELTFGDLGVWSDALREPTVSNPGAYRAISVEIELFGIAICAIMNSSLLDTIGVAISGENKVDSMFGEQVDSAAKTAMPDTSAMADASCARAFNVLKALVAEWIHTVETNGFGVNHADVFLVKLYKYLCGFGGDSLMTDSALHRIVYGLMSKLFKRLISEFQVLGVDIVFANFEKIIINTKKYSSDAAMEYLDFVVSTVKAIDVFKYLHLNTKRVWEQLLWLERENWGGIELHANDVPLADSLAASTEPDPFIESAEPAAGEDLADEEEGGRRTSASRFNDEEDSERASDRYTKAQKKKLEKDAYAFLSDDFDEAAEEDSDGGDNELEAHGHGVAETTDTPAVSESIYGEWNLAVYLPAAAAEYFLFFVNEFMRQHSRKRQELVGGYAADGMNVYADDDVDELRVSFQVTDFMKGLITGKVTKKLLEVLEELQYMYGNGRDSEKFFPKRAGSHLQLKNPALEFAKAVAYIYALDSELEAEVAALRRNLLSKLEIREFNSVSEFKDPSLSFVLRDVICSFCSSCRDIDMLRDYGVAVNSSSESVPETRNWDLLCPSCGSIVDEESIECRLIDEVNKARAAYILQDFRCAQTHQVSIRFCSSQSDLARPLQMDIPPAEYRQQMETLLKVAVFHNFEWLESAVRDVLV